MESTKTKTKTKKKKKNTSLEYSYWNPRPKNKCIGFSEKPIYLICSDFYANLCSKIEADKNKYNIFWELIKAYKLNDNKLYGNKLRIIEPSIATRDDLLLYHDENYICLLETIENYPQYSTQTQEEKDLITEYGLVDDCPIFDDLYEYSLNIVGSSLKCAQLIKENQTRIAINFGGGRHHAFSSKASGYCYVNDIILCIDSLLLSDNFNKILYMDLDLHHCNAVQEAYYSSNNVFTFSIHFKDLDFFPQTGCGNKNKFGDKNGEFYNLNIPISKFELCDDAFCDIINKLSQRLNYYFQPDAIIICCGCDGLQSDPLKKWNLTINGISKAVNIIVTQMDKPTIILGGGGYNPVDTAKCWTKIISNTAQIPISNDIPYHNNFTQFAPHYFLNKIILPFTHNHHNHHNHHNYNNYNNKKINIHAMQMIYAHLNNFERLFVQTNLKNNKNIIKNGVKSIKNNKNKNKNKKQPLEIKEEEQEDNDLISDDNNNNNNNNDDDNPPVGTKRTNPTTNTCRSRRKRRKF